METVELALESVSGPTARLLEPLRDPAPGAPQAVSVFQNRTRRSTILPMSGWESALPV